ncbi:RDD family protein [Legionella clemsonensis]|uniref:RDD family protein n=1 Tax=Legionella clemsonensis TaxID=1867846 RepID=A0A222NZA0_9GAMM|nr:RDD family protein [Legionella clemsonensis]ASQ44899.1 RDD family protein [Legionella clemsonensis]
MLFRYIAAQIYDSFILTALSFGFTAICLLTTHGMAIAPATKWYQYSLLTLFIGYYLTSIRHGGQTIGMRAWRLQLISDNGKLNWWQAAGRLILVLPALAGGLLRFRNPQQLLYRWTKTRLQLISL